MKKINLLFPDRLLSLIKLTTQNEVCHRIVFLSVRLNRYPNEVIYQRHLDSPERLGIG